MNRMDTKVYVRLVVWNVTRSTKYFENIVRKHTTYRESLNPWMKINSDWKIHRAHVWNINL